MNEQERLMLLDWTRKIHTMEYAYRFESIDYREYGMNEEESYHNNISTGLENLRHRCEYVLCAGENGSDTMSSILNDWNSTDKPNVSDENFKKASNIVKELGSYPEKGIQHKT